MNLKQWMSATLIIFLIACASKPVNPPDPKPDPKTDGINSSSEISGQVLEWKQKGRAGVARAVISSLDTNASSGYVHAVVAQGSIDAQGKLILKLSTVPPTGFLRPFEVCGIKTEANSIEANIDVAQTGLEADGSTFFAFLGQENDTAQVIRLYSDRNLEVSGPCRDGGISATLSLKKGWNLMLKTFTQPGKTGAVYSSADGVAGVPFTIKLIR